MKMIIAVGSLLGALSLQVPVLDLTSPPTEPFDTSGRSTRIAELPLQVTLTGIPDQPYAIGDDFEYELGVANSTQIPIALPWSGSPVGTSEVKSLVRILMSSAGSPDKFLDGTFAFGDPQVPGSMHTLGPNELVRIRARGRWRVPQVANLVEELSLTSGRYQLRARFSIDDGSTTARTELSPPVWVTLLLRQ